MKKTPDDPRNRRKAELSLLNEFLEDDDHFQGGKYDKPIHLRAQEEISNSPTPGLTHETSPSPQVFNEISTFQKSALNAVNHETGEYKGTGLSAPASLSKWEQSGSKVIANQEQTGSKVVAEPPSEVVANQEQSGSKVIANQEQTGSTAESAIAKTGSKVVAELIAEVVANQEQTGSKSDSKLVANLSFSRLTGIQRNITILLYEECKKARSKVTDEMRLSEIANIVKAAENTTKNAINRLIEKKVTRRFEYKDGRGGWTRYELANNIYHEIRERELNSKVVAKWEQSSSKVGAQLVAKLVATPSSSSSNININEKLTTTQQESIPDHKHPELPTQWNEIDFSELVELGVPFSRSHLKQWYERDYCGAQEAQESIWHFGFYLRNAKKEDFKTSPLNFFMGIMSKSRYFARPEGYLSPEEIALQCRAEDARKKSENLARLQEELFESAFENWFHSLNEGQIKEVAPQFTSFDLQKKYLKQLFRDQHFLTLKDNPSLDSTKLGIKIPTSKERAFIQKEKDLESEIHWLREYLTKHPRDEDCYKKLRAFENELANLRQRSPVA